MPSYTNPDGSTTDCNLLSSVLGPKEFVKVTEVDCVRDFTCKIETQFALLPGSTFSVKCPGKMRVSHHKQEITDFYICEYRGDCIYITYPTSQKRTITWTENGPCGVEGRCCPPGTSPVGPPEGEPPDGWQPPTTVPPDEENPFV